MTRPIEFTKEGNECNIPFAASDLQPKGSGEIKINRALSREIDMTRPIEFILCAGIWEYWFRDKNTLLLKVQVFAFLAGWVEFGRTSSIGIASADD